MVTTNTLVKRLSLSSFCKTLTEKLLC